MVESSDKELYGEARKQRLQVEKKELWAEQEQMGEENEAMRRRIESLELANSALTARNKVLEQLKGCGGDTGLQQAVQAGMQNKM